MASVGLGSGWGRGRARVRVRARARARVRATARARVRARLTDRVGEPAQLRSEQHVQEGAARGEAAEHARCADPVVAVRLEQCGWDRLVRVGIRG